MACWIYLNSNETDRVIIFGNYNANPFVNWELATNCTQRLCVGGTSNYTTRTNSTVIPKTTWTHIAVTYNGTTTTFYQNGISVGSANGVNTLTTKTASSRFYLGSDVRNDATRLKGKMNDFRFYDHCLSAAEVHEIAQGLVLHYKLDGGVFGNSNLYTGSEKFSGSWTNSTYWATSSDTFQNFTVKERTGTWHGLAQNVPCTQGDILTISFWGRVDSGGTIQSVHRSSLGNVDTGLSLIDGNFSNGIYWVRATDDGTAWKRYWGTVQVTSSDITYLQWRIENSVANKTIQVCGFKVEKGNTATHWCPADSELNFDSKFVHDSSGYGHNGTINNNLTITNNTIRYSNSTEFPGTAYIKLPSPSNEIRTISLWAKWNTIPSGQSVIYVDQKSKTGLGLASSGIIVNTNQTGHTFSKSSLIANTWYHFVIVSPNGSSNATRQLYINGTEQTALSSTSSWTYTIDELQLGKRSTSSDGFKGIISDFRMYCTALDADDILALYHTGAKIDNKANIHTYEINEFKTNKLTKTGILYDNMIESIKVLPDDSYWQLVLFHYVDGGNNLFTSTNAIDCNEFGLFSRLKDIDNFTYNNKYEFYVIQDDTEFRWTQTNKPTASAISGLSVVSGYTNPVNGLAKASQSNTYIGYGSWWGACGCYTSYTQSGKTGIPGFGPHNANGICTRYLALYARIPSPSAKLADQLANSSEFIEL